MRILRVGYAVGSVAKRSLESHSRPEIHNTINTKDTMGLTDLSCGL